MGSFKISRALLCSLTSTFSYFLLSINSKLVFGTNLEKQSEFLSFRIFLFFFCSVAEEAVYLSLSFKYSLVVPCLPNKPISQCLDHTYYLFDLIIPSIISFSCSGSQRKENRYQKWLKNRGRENPPIFSLLPCLYSLHSPQDPLKLITSHFN